MRNTLAWRAFAALCTVFVLAFAATAPAAAKNVLRWASQGDALTFDPHAQNETPTHVSLHQTYEPLLSRRADLSLSPVLALSWEPVEPTVWEFVLRPDVRFHDGALFTAEDVKFSIERALQPTSDFSPLINTVERVEIVDPLTVRMHTAVPTPLLPVNLTNVYMMSKAWAEANDVVTVQDFAAAEETFAVRNGNGTGPFKLTLREPGIRSVYARNEDWWGLEEEPHNVDELIFTPIENNATRVAALLSGEIDILLDPPLQDLRRIERQPGLGLEQVPQIRTIFLGMAQARDELLFSDVEGKNPFQDKRVRQAIYQAIDINTIQRVIMRGLSVPAGIIAAPGVNGHTPELDTRLPYDPDASRALLAEAGYADGFTIRLDCPNDRYMNDEAICQAMVAMLARVGITARLDAQTKSLHFPKIDNRQTDFYLQGWGVPTLDSEYIFSFLYVTGRRNNGTGYSNPRLDALAAAMAQELDQDKRDAMIAEAWQIVKDDIVFIPLHHQVIVWAVRDGITMPITANNTAQFRWARFE